MQMKKILGLFLLVALVFGISSPCFAKEDEERSHILKVYNWADYVDEDLLTEFETWYKEQTGEEVHVLYQLFDINEVMLTKIEKGHEDYDVVCPSDYIIERMLKHDLLLPISRDFGNTPDYTVNVSQYAKNQFDKMSVAGKNANEYSVGYMWGTTGILYNTQYVTAEEASTWNVLWNPKFNNKVLMKDAFRDVYGSIMRDVRQSELMSGSVSRDIVMNDASDEALKQFEDTMIAAKSNISGWEVDFGKERMIQGKAWINVTWSGDVMWALDEVGDAVSLEYTVPVEGSNVWFDGWVISKYAKNEKAARYFINFMCMPENAIKNMDAIGYVSVIGTPEILEAKIDSTLDSTVDLSYFFGPDADSVKVNSIQYPDASTIERCALMHDCDDRTEAMLDMWSRIKGDSLNATSLILVGIVVIAIIASVILKKRKNRNKKKNSKKVRR